jgi:hypothetical protein
LGTNAQTFEIENHLRVKAFAQTISLQIAGQRCVVAIGVPSCEDELNYIRRIRRIIATEHHCVGQEQ